MVKIGVGHHHQVVFRSAKRLDTLATLGRFAIDVFGDRRGTDKGKRLHLRMRNKRVDSDFITLHDVENAIRQTGLFE